MVTAGGAQAMLKGGLALPGRTAVVAGTGPLLLPVATGLAAAGARVTALVEWPTREMSHAGPAAWPRNPPSSPRRRATRSDSPGTVSR
ncbi:hypothetical protein SMICM17S_01724 [Streptomyces microflavus]